MTISISIIAQTRLEEAKTIWKLFDCAWYSINIYCNVTVIGIWNITLTNASVSSYTHSNSFYIIKMNIRFTITLDLFQNLFFSFFIRYDFEIVVCFQCNVSCNYMCQYLQSLNLLGLYQFYSTCSWKNYSNSLAVLMWQLF